MIIIGDIAGEYDALIKLVDKFPKDEQIVLVGDLNDRGAKTMDVINWAKNNKRVKTVHSNHGDLFIDFIKETGKYGSGVFEMNGGGSTLDSYINNKGKLLSHIEWLDTLPMKYEDENVIVTHAPIDHRLGEAVFVKNNTGNNEYDVLWSRSHPRKMDKLQVSGHNSQWGVSWFINDGEVSTDENKKDIAWAFCIDDSRHKRLTALQLPSRDIIQEPF